MPRIMDNVISGGVGAAAGVGSYFVDKKDAERAAALPAGTELSVVNQFGTWYHYAIPGIATVLSLLGVVKGDWQTRLISVGYTLAGRKAPEQIEIATAKPKPLAGRSSAERAALEAQRQAQLQAQLGVQARRQPAGQYVIEEEYKILS